MPSAAKKKKVERPIFRWLIVAKIGGDGVHGIPGLSGHQEQQGTCAKKWSQKLMRPSALGAGGMRPRFWWGEKTSHLP